MSKRIHRLPAVLETTGLSRSLLHVLVTTDRFPKPVRIGTRAVGWLEEEVDAWLDARKGERDSVATLDNLSQQSTDGEVK